MYFNDIDPYDFYKIYATSSEQITAVPIESSIQLLTIKIDMLRNEKSSASNEGSVNYDGLNTITTSSLSEVHQHRHCLVDF